MIERVSTIAQRLGLQAAEAGSSEEVETDYRSLAVTWIIGATIVRFFCVGTLPLGNGEAYYYTWSRFLDWSYYDHPPLVAWMVRLTTLAATSASLVRLGPLLCSAVAGLLIYFLGERLYQPRAAFLGMALVTALPVFLVSSFVVNPEAPLAPLWVAFLLTVEGMRRGDEAWRPLLAGVFLGLAFLAKYTALLLVPAALLYLALSGRSRRWLTRPSLYLGGAVALLLAMPVLYWNHTRGWPTLALHFAERNEAALPVPGENPINDLVGSASATGWGMLSRLVRTGVGQLMSYSPLLAPLLLFGLFSALRRARRSDSDLFVAVFGWGALLPLLVALAKVKDSEQHWTMVAFIPAAIAAGRLAEESGALARWVRWLMGAGVAVTALALLVITVHAHTTALVRLLPKEHYDPRADIVNELVGWDEVRTALGQVEQDVRGPLVLASNHYSVCGRMLFETGDAPQVYCPTERRTEFDYLNRRHPPAEATVLALTSDVHPELPAELAARGCTLARTVEVTRAGLIVARYQLHLCPPVPGNVLAETASAR